MFNAKDRALNQNPGTLPDVTDSLFNWFRPLIFVRIATAVARFQAAQTKTRFVSRGVVQPLPPQRLMLKPEGERAWKWYTVHALLDVILDAGDDIEIVNAADSVTSFRVMSRKDYREYGYVEYEAVQDYTP